MIASLGWCLHLRLGEPASALVNPPRRPTTLSIAASDPNEAECRRLLIVCLHPIPLRVVGLTVARMAQEVEGRE